MAEAGSDKPRGRLTPARRRLLDRLLDDLLDRSDSDRREMLAECRRRAPRIASWLERLAAASTEPGGMLDDSARHLASDALEARVHSDACSLEPGTRLGPWRLIERIGTGGMGEVYRAERADGTFEMQVAVKLIRTHSDDLARLLTFERQTLAHLSHPGIARLLDGGLTDDGRPYLVMDWVDGETLDDWCRGQEASVDDCLRVFVEACDAVLAAHRELIVHGDIKPSNLKVTDSGRVCLLDFGVARLLDREGQHELPTALTPGFAAPEVMEGEPVSTAADIYGLGALLHWLTYGHAPGRGGPDQMRQAWRGYRRRRDLQAIIDRATHPDPAERYATVNALALEIRRLQSDRPLRARAVRLPERMALWARRHTVGAVLGGVALAILIAAVGGVGWQARVASVERDLAQAEAARSNALREHLTLLFREVGSLADDTEEMTARELLDRTADVAGEWLAEDPDLRQQVNAVLGEIMIALNDYASAESLLADFAGGDAGSENPLLHSIALLDMAQVHHRRGRIAEGLELAEQAVGMLEALPGTHPARLSDGLQILGRLRRDAGQFEAAVSDLRRARELALEVSAGPRPLMARAENNLAITLLIGGDLEAAARHLEAAEALWLALGRDDSSDALSVMANLASVLDRIGRSDEAEQRLRRVIEIRREQYGPSAAMAAARLALGRLLVVRGDYEAAERQLEQAAETFARFIGDDTPDYAAARFGRGELAEARGNFERALEHYRKAEELMTGLLGEHHPYSLQTRLALLGVERRLDLDFDPADYEQLSADAEAAGGAARSVASAVACERARFELERGRYDAAGEQAEECLNLRQAAGLGGWRLTEAEALIAAADAAGDDQPELSQLVEQLAAAMHPEHPVVTWFDQLDKT
ncbi:serine/threonine protein kinase [Wenzhouxiangella sp. XN201]|uniref:protein kinase domain-containing protein n=1 Tax=Wenzhouxiangella sp. XN201 TaxID=2710755 RepID=UPI0013CAD0C4|nr:serine/threonine protein kinase [Wenzhouxiangella sp. XN201]